MSDWPEGGTGRMFRLISELPQQLAASARHAGLRDLRPLVPGPRRVLLCGMGGSAIAGDLIQPLLTRPDYSFDVVRDYHLPAWADTETLVIASSYSGNTEETLSCVDEARGRGCRLVALSSGGQLLDQAGGEPGFPAVVLPGGLPPRASLGLGLGSLLRLLERLGLLSDVETQIQRAVVRLENDAAGYLAPLMAATRGETDPAPTVATDEAAAATPSPATLADALLTAFPVIYTTSPEAHAAGMRLKAQLNENGKSPAYCVPFPELDHNDIVGWSLTPQQRRQFVLLVLRGGDEEPHATRRVAVTKDLLAGEFAGIHDIRAVGQSTLERILSLVQYGDYLSCYLALRKGVDAVPVDRIESLKRQLNEGAAP